MRGGALGAEEQQAAAKALVHANTPTSAYLDSLGRTFLTVADNGAAGKYATRTLLDIQNKQRAVSDALGREVIAYEYDMQRQRVHQASMEAGEQWTLNDALGKGIRAWDNRGHNLRTEYDALRRHLNPPKAGPAFHPFEVMHFSWNAVPGAVSYQWDAATDPEFPVGTEIHFDNIPPSAISDFTVQFEDSNIGSYHARVRAVTVSGILGVPSNLVPFTVEFDVPLPPPTPIAPANHATVTLPVTIRWTDVPNPQPSGYSLEIADDPGFSKLEFLDNQITPPTVTLPSLTSGTKYWRVLSQQGDSGPNTPAVTAWSTTQSFTIPSTPPRLHSIAVTNPSPGPGFSETVSLQLTTPAPRAGAVIKLTSSDPSAAPIPATFTMPAGTALGQVTFQVGEVTTPTPVKLTASINGTSASTNITVEPPSLQSISFDGSSTLTGGFGTRATIVLTGTAPVQGLGISLSSSSSALRAPASVDVPAGSSTVQVFLGTRAVAMNTPVSLTATLDGNSLQTSITLTPQIAPASLSLDPSTTGSSTCCSNGTVTIDAPVTTDTDLFVSSGNPKVAAVPKVVVIPAGTTTGGFFIDTFVPAATTTVTVSVRGAGVTRSAILTVVPPWAAPTTVTTVNLNAASIVGGHTSRGTVTLSNAAPSGGTVVSLGNSTAEVKVPASVTVPEGSTAASFTLTTSPVTASTTVSIYAAAGGETQTVRLTVTPK